MKKKLAVIALGGNALLRGDQIGTIDEQEQNTADTLQNLMYLIKEGYDLIIAHGNGPQVGNILMRNDAGETMYGIAQMPLDVCVADSQGGIGYMIERILRNTLKDHGISKEVLTVVTPVLVDINDPAFSNPTKPVGKYYTKEQADELTAAKGWIFKASPKGDGYRRNVPSPKPLAIMNEKVIESMARAGTIVIAVGGGGIPVYIDENKNVRPAEAVIDKDTASALLAARIGADEFYILTDVPFVYINYKKENEEKLEFLTYDMAKKHLDAGMFGEGSMAPKIRACMEFVKGGGEMAVITEATKLEDMSYGSKITLH
ncbi:MAG TPA: carbamate kinase [Bacteroidales bacterium]|nr:carbamate kinase [Bacteroidales bacterium]